jgi:hypothetical protein
MAAEERLRLHFSIFDTRDGAIHWLGRASGLTRGGIDDGA